MALWLLLRKSCSYSHFRPLLVLASGSQLHDFFALPHQSREKQILSSQGLAVRNKSGFVAQTYIIGNKIKVILKVWWFQTLFWPLQVILCLVITHFVVLSVSTLFSGTETEQCRQFAFYFPFPLFTAYSFPFFNSSATCMSVVDPYETKLPWDTSINFYAQFFKGDRRLAKKLHFFFLSPTKSSLFYTFSILWSGKPSSHYKERNLVILNIGKGVHRDMC